MNLNLDQESIINILGIQSLADDKKSEILEQSSELIQKRLLIRVMKSLDDTKRVEFEALLENPDQSALDGFLSANVPEFSNWVLEEVNGLKSELSAIAGKIE